MKQRTINNPQAAFNGGKQRINSPGIQILTITWAAQKGPVCTYILKSMRGWRAQFLTKKCISKQHFHSHSLAFFPTIFKVTFQQITLFKRGIRRRSSFLVSHRRHSHKASLLSVIKQFQFVQLSEESRASFVLLCWPFLS